jgi:hypothetical protein
MATLAITDIKMPAAAAPNTTRSAANVDLLAIETVMKTQNANPKIRIGSRSCVAGRDRASYKQKAKAANSATLLRSILEGC